MSDKKVEEERKTGNKKRMDNNVNNDDSIQTWQKRLSDVQQQRPLSSYRLSERNTADLLMKMIDLGYFRLSPTTTSSTATTNHQRESVLRSNFDRNDGENYENYEDDENDSNDDDNSNRDKNKDDCCEIILTSSSSAQRGCITLSHLIFELGNEIGSAGGRLGVSEACHLLGVDECYIRRAADYLCNKSVVRSGMNNIDNVCSSCEKVVDGDELQVKSYHCHTSNEDFVMIGSDLISSSYLDRLVEDINTIVQSRGGRVLISDLASTTFHLPVSVTARVIKDRIHLLNREGAREPREGERVKLSGGLMGRKGGTRMVSLRLRRDDREIVTEEYEDLQLARVRGAFHALTMPTTVESVIRNFADVWDYAGAVDTVVECVRRLCEDGTLPGELRTSSSSSSSSSSTASGGQGVSNKPSISAVISAAGAIYVPRVYSMMQRRGVDRFYTTNGYVTRGTLRGMGIAEGRMVEFLRKSFPGALALPRSMVNPAVVSGQLESALIEAVTDRSFVDCTLHVPDAIVSEQGDVLALLEGHILPTIRPELQRLKEERMVITTTGAVGGGGRDGGSGPRVLATTVDGSSTGGNSVDDSESKKALTETETVTVDGTDGCDESDGWILARDGEEGVVVYFSPGMIEDVKHRILQPLAELYGKERAKEIMDHRREKLGNRKKKKSCNAEHDEDEEMVVGGTTESKIGKRRGQKKKGSNKRQQHKPRSRRGGRTDDGVHFEEDEEGDGGTEKVSAREKRQRSKTKKKKPGSGKDEWSVSTLNESECGVMSLDKVAFKVAEEYPELGEMEDGDFGWSGGGSELNNVAVDWKDESDDHNTSSYLGVLYEFCRSPAIYEYAKSLCTASARASFELLHSSLAGGCLSSCDRNDPAQTRAMEHTFETSVFPPACHHVKMFSRLAASASASSVDNGLDEEHVRDDLELEFLSYVGSDFARRITQYALWKHGIVDDNDEVDVGDDKKVKFSFYRDERFKKESESSSTTTDDDDTIHTYPANAQQFSELGSARDGRSLRRQDVLDCFHPPNVAVRTIPPAYLSCSSIIANDNSGGVHDDVVDPVQALRDAIPGPVGVALARTWILCGAESYEGGETAADNENEAMKQQRIIRRRRRGNFGGFLKHLEELCLTMCGLPFKTLDKKTEKQAMFYRRRELTSALERSSDAREIFDLAIILLFQQVKNMAVVLGEKDNCISRRILLKMLSNSTGSGAVPEHVVTELRLFAEKLSNGENQGKSAIHAIRSIGLCRDISKYSV